MHFRRRRKRNRDLSPPSPLQPNPVSQPYICELYAPEWKPKGPTCQLPPFPFPNVLFAQLPLPLPHLRRAPSPSMHPSAVVSRRVSRAYPLFCPPLPHTSWQPQGNPRPKTSIFGEMPPSHWPMPPAIRLGSRRVPHAGPISLACLTENGIRGPSNGPPPSHPGVRLVSRRQDIGDSMDTGKDGCVCGSRIRTEGRTEKRERNEAPIFLFFNLPTRPRVAHPPSSHTHTHTSSVHHAQQGSQPE
ncbi:hypothetical protein QBC39DRAFT_146562 [Podospora conica]|nr:hypothetical protein QBC39DRAFT_146562 [Schizothecium conicum]